MSDYSAYVYIMASSFRRLYIGLTTQIEIRVRQHKNHINPNCHTAKYNIHDLVYFERFSSILAAIRREKVLKGWLRVRKLELIVSTNPEWRDLSENWGKLAEPFDLSREKELMRPPQSFS
jgi:putative endonuclease